jgi:hypothetical protein
MKGIYAEIGALMDARYGVVRRLNPEAAKNLIKNGYHYRKGDFFQGVSKEAYDELYNKYEVETLQETMMTNIFVFLAPQIAELMKETIAQELPDHQKPTLDVNVWPYDFQADEMATLRSIIYLQFQGRIGVNVFSKDIKNMTPAACAENYVMMVMYDYHHYLNAHANALIKNPKPFLMLVAPMVYFNSDPDQDEEVIEQMKRGINSLAVLEAAVAPRIHLKFINVEHFSIIYPDERLAGIEEPDVSKHISLDELDKKLEEQRKAN